MRSPYRHSVWIEVFGVVLFGLVLLGGAGYLLSNMGDMTGGSGGGGAAIASGGRASPAPQARSGLRARRSAPASRRPSIFGEGTSADGGSGAAVPFSEGWQEEATPDLTGPAGSGGVGSGGVPSGGGAIGEGAPASEGPTIASRRPPSGGESGAGRTSIRPEHSSWRAEAQNLSGRARALSNQLGQMERRQERGASEQQAESSPEDPDARTSASEGSASTSSDPGTPDPPNEVPIGGLEWLAAVGLLYGLRRLGFSGEP